MKHLIAATALAATVAQPASAITFQSLTTIYVASGVFDDGGGSNSGAATVATCSNVSGQLASIRFLFLDVQGNTVGNLTRAVAHGGSIAVATHNAAAYSESGFLGTGALVSGAVLNIESTQSGVFCTAAITNAAGSAHEGAPLHLIRVNPHPGTVE
jgi:hypothetical protein